MYVLHVFLNLPDPLWMPFWAFPRVFTRFLYEAIKNTHVFLPLGSILGFSSCLWLVGLGSEVVGLGFKVLGLGFEVPRLEEPSLEHGSPDPKPWSPTLNLEAEAQNYRVQPLKPWSPITRP